jgi:hypothetical protein
MLWNPPAEIQVSCFRSAARRLCWMAEQCSEARVRFAAANRAAAAPLLQRSTDVRNFQGCSDGNQKLRSLLCYRRRKPVRI